MLAKLGFADPDRREQRHDVACQYLATPDAIRRLIPYLKIECGPEPHAENSGSEEEVSQVTCRHALARLAAHNLAERKVSCQFPSFIQY